mmetsp:Transcript_315/g.763  ORF Transcript_315/g.763 Transcript_315/m.763 type:complete len:82 (+) Transcript_315:73-318(+)
MKHGWGLVVAKRDFDQMCLIFYNSSGTTMAVVAKAAMAAFLLDDALSFSESFTSPGARSPDEVSSAPPSDGSIGEPFSSSA